MLGYGIRYYLMMKCISTLFQKDDDGNTPIQHACTRHERNNVMDVVEETFAKYIPNSNVKTSIAQIEGKTQTMEPPLESAMNDNNSDYKETILLNSNDEKPSICAVRARLKICQRIVGLQGANLITMPLPIYYNFSRSSITNITSDLVTGITRELASELYDMHDKK